MDPTENKLKDISSVTSELLREKELNGSVKEFFFNELAYFSHEADPENPDDSDSPFRANLWQLLRFANMLTKKDITNRSEPMSSDTRAVYHGEVLAMIIGFRQFGGEWSDRLYHLLQRQYDVAVRQSEPNAEYASDGKIKLPLAAEAKDEDGNDLDIPLDKRGAWYAFQSIARTIRTSNSLKATLEDNLRMAMQDDTYKDFIFQFADEMTSDVKTDDDAGVKKKARLMRYIVAGFDLVMNCYYEAVEEININYESADMSGEFVDVQVGIDEIRASLRHHLEKLDPYDPEDEEQMQSAQEKVSSGILHDFKHNSVIRGGDYLRVSGETIAYIFPAEGEVQIISLSDNVHLYGTVSGFGLNEIFDESHLAQLRIEDGFQVPEDEQIKDPFGAIIKIKNAMLSTGENISPRSDIFIPVNYSPLRVAKMLS